jgi:hypothetical protein
VFSGMQQCFGSGSTMQYYFVFVTNLDKLKQVYNSDKNLRKKVASVADQICELK